MSYAEDTSTEVVPQVSADQSAMATALPNLPPGLKPPVPLKTDGNLCVNWKRFKRGWNNYAIVARLDRFEETFKVAMFLTVIEETLEMYEGVHFAIETDRQILNNVVETFEEFCVGETNETYERFIFNRRNQEDSESIDQYVTVLRKLAQT